MRAVTVRHNFETAHRLYQLAGKCRNLHGHSWWCEISVSGDVDASGVLIDFGVLKALVRGWIDDHLDHATMLGRMDPLVQALRADGTKLFEFGADPPVEDLDWPSVENVAELLHRVTTDLLTGNGYPDLRCTRVRVTETHVNAAEVQVDPA